MKKHGYGGLTAHRTADEAEPAAGAMLDKVCALDPTVGWMAIWFCVATDYNYGSPDAGKCFHEVRAPSA